MLILKGRRRKHLGFRSIIMMILFFLLLGLGGEDMNKESDLHIDRYLTPYKLGRPIITPSGLDGTFNKYGVDCPFVFYHNDMFYMMFVGFDGLGYQTALAVSKDLVNWEIKKVILPRDENRRWDGVSIAGTWIIKNDNLFELPTLKKINGRYWLVYHSYPGYGYEEGPAEIGLAWSEDDELLEWHRLDKPILSWKDGSDWEKGGLYKACIVEDNGTYYMFYNAKNSSKGPWIEQIGLAVSKDLVHWERYSGNPVLKVTENSWDSRFVSDPYVAKDNDKWVMFYYGYNHKNAQDGIAFSKDLFNWIKYGKPILTNGSEGDIDEIHAHKPAVIYHNNRLYHFYCAVRRYKEGDTVRDYNEFRTITVASSYPF